MRILIVLLCLFTVTASARYWVNPGGAASSFVDVKSTSFSASNQQIHYGNNLAYEYTQAWTISCWIKASSLVQNYKTFAGKIASSPYEGYEFQIKNQTLEVDIAHSGSAFVEVHTTSNVITSTSTWYHVAWTNSGSGTGAGQKIYVNGSSVGVSTLTDSLASGTIIATSEFAVGNRADGTAAFAGNVDDCSMFNAALSAGNITTLYNSGHAGDLTGMTNLQFWTWMGDGDNATNAGGVLDHSGNGYNGTGGNITGSNFVSDVP